MNNNENNASDGRMNAGNQNNNTQNNSNTVKDPDDWKTGGEGMTGAQRSYLKTLSDGAGEPFDEHLSKADAAKRIDELQKNSKGNNPGQASGNAGASNTVKDPDEWKTGDQAMTGAQRSYLKTLSDEAGEDLDENISKAEASKKIDELQHKTGRGLDKNE
jgi:hypothetical protein